MKNNIKEIKNKFSYIIEKNIKSGEMLSTKRLRDYYKLLNENKKDLIFYKYCNCDYYTIRNIEKSTLALKKYTEFNDPYEGIALTNSSIEKPDMDIIRNSAMVTCFTENKNHLLMFAHYADSYKGVCIQYDLSLLDDDVYHGVSSYLFPVIYSDKPANLLYKTELKTYIEKYKAGKICLSRMDDILSYFVRKADAWKKECEWRLVIPINCWKHMLGMEGKDNKSVAILQNFDCISAIYFGVQLAEDKKEHIKEIVEKLNKNRGSKQPIKIYQTTLNDKKYKLDNKRLK